MDIHLLRAFQFQIALQCEFAIQAATEIDEGLNNQQVGRIFYGVQNLLNATANISKALWGQSGSKSAPRKPLRDSLSITDNSPIRATTARNHFEHFDERLDQWWTDSKRHAFIDLNIAPLKAFETYDPQNIFRSLDPTSRNLVFWGDEFDLTAILLEIQRIHPLAKAAYQSPPPISPAQRPLASASSSGPDDDTEGQQPRSARRD